MALTSVNGADDWYTTFKVTSDTPFAEVREKLQKLYNEIIPEFVQEQMYSEIK